METHPRDRDLDADLVEQLTFLRSSCDAFDRGTLPESKRIAVAIRVLVHDTPHSRSLLSQLGRKTSLRWADSAPVLDSDPTVAARSPGLTGMGATPQGIAFLSRDADQISSSPFTRHVDFEEWWVRPVILDSKGIRFSRKQLVLALANKDGGAHIDRLQASTFALIHENSAGWIRTDGLGSEPEPLPTPVYASLRTIGEEVFVTLLNAGNVVPDSTVPAQLRISASMDHFKAGEAGPAPVFDEHAPGNSHATFTFGSLPGKTVEAIRCADDCPDPVSGSRFPAGWIKFSVVADEDGRIVHQSGTSGPVPTSTPPDDTRSTLSPDAVCFAFDNFPEATFYAERATEDRTLVDPWGVRHTSKAGWVDVHVTLAGTTWPVAGFAGPDNDP